MDLACSLVGWQKEEDEWTRLHVFPLFRWNEDGLLTILGGRYAEGNTTNTCITPLVGVRSGSTMGGWAFPFWSHEKNADFDRKLSYMDAPTLSAEIQVTEGTNWTMSCEHHGKTYLEGDFVWSSDKKDILLHDFIHRIHGHNGPNRNSTTNVYRLVETCKRGNKLLFNFKAERRATFDLKTRAKMSDTDDDEASLLVWLYQYDGNRDRMKGNVYTRHRVLWRLWDWEKKDVDVSLDVFPGFTYDSRGDGYEKTSFLWRFFRYENDPKAGTSVDFLFLPIWR